MQTSSSNNNQYTMETSYSKNDDSRGPGFDFDPFPQKKNSSKATLNLSELRTKLKALIKLTMSEEGSRIKVVEKMRELQKKRRVVNFLKTQFGTQNQFCAGTRPECVQDLDSLNYDYESLVLDEKVSENVMMIQQIQYDMRQKKRYKQVGG